MSNFVKHQSRIWSSILFLLLSACYQMPDRSVDNVTNNAQIKAKWTSMSAGTVRSILRENLELDPTISEEAAVYTLLESSQLTLGQSNFASYIEGDDKAAATKAKRLAEIFMSACWLGMNKPTVIARYLPTSTDFRPLFLGFLGREPSASESRELNFLSQGVLRNSEGSSDSPETKSRRVRAALCTAVLASLDGTRGR